MHDAKGVEGLDRHRPGACYLRSLVCWLYVCTLLDSYALVCPGRSRVSEGDSMAQFALVLLHPDFRERRENPSTSKGKVPTPDVSPEALFVCHILSSRPTGIIALIWDAGMVSSLSTSLYHSPTCLALIPHLEW